MHNRHLERILSSSSLACVDLPIPLVFIIISDFVHKKPDLFPVVELGQAGGSSTPLSSTTPSSPDVLLPISSSCSPGFLDSVFHGYSNVRSCHSVASTPAVTHAATPSDAASFPGPGIERPVPIAGAWAMHAPLILLNPGQP